MIRNWVKITSCSLNPECSGMIRHIPESSVFLVLSSPGGGQKTGRKPNTRKKFFFISLPLAFVGFHCKTKNLHLSFVHHLGKKCDILTSFSLFFVASEGTYPRGVRDAFRHLVSIYSLRYSEMRFRPSSSTADGPTDRAVLSVMFNHFLLHCFLPLLPGEGGRCHCSI